MKAFNSYSKVMFTPEQLRRVVAELARVLPEYMAKYDFDTIAVTGKSGCAVGFALSMMTGIHVVYIRKGETSHGDMVEGDGHEFHRYAFFDDFVSSGASRDRVQDELDLFCKVRDFDKARCVFTIEYSKMNTATKLSTYGRIPSLHVADPDCLPSPWNTMPIHDSIAAMKNLQAAAQEQDRAVIEALEDNIKF